MKRSVAFILFIKLLFVDLRNILKVLLRYTNEADKKYEAIKKYQLKDGLPFIDLNELVPNLNEEIVNYTYLDGTSLAIDIAFIKAMCRKYNDCNYLEIGSWRGESLVNIAQVAKQCTSISLSKEEIIAMGGGERAANLQRLFTDDIKNIKHIEHNSLTFDFGSLNEKFDIIFVDGDHTYTGVNADTKNAFKLLKDENSVIIWHDCGTNCENMRYEVLAAILDGCPPEERKYIYRVSNTLCGIYTKQKINSSIMTSPQIPNKTFTVNIKTVPYNKNIKN